ncbi:hypothetical protein [Arcobacter porcinus]|uniref:Uncharacterized protein n=1 Tax=Arcobacter porcinus TaxID=1935204 RepID=A0A1C0AXB4_9BACT|nr:hypothetical protein [Arcobacter porcinus]OCL97268.1 hypothetical protein AAX27_00175 [Aliarcobacter thereius]OCL84169.1 hypothetical protein AAW30_00542 [Arcobacter porcinus]OCL84693.1 hypothetical protein AAW29_00371 [Arcobacter porcinus]OCL89233.1 hypothetical protein AAX30_00370 [Arcobacter porcinus]OCL91653.1 hypothetical protein AAX28_01398 [Arcobacter porcinus]
MRLKIKREYILNLFITFILICAIEILKILVKGDLVSAVAFGILSILMLLSYLIIGEKEDKND